MKPTTFPESNVTFAKDQPEYLPLPAWRDCAEGFEKEIVADDRRWSAYERELSRAMQVDAAKQKGWRPIWAATAEQRCRAFVATMEGKEK